MCIRGPHYRGEASKTGPIPNISKNSPDLSEIMFLWHLVSLPTTLFFSRLISGSSVKSESRMMTLRLFVKQYLQTPLKCEDSLTPPRISDHLLFDQYPRLRIDYDPYDISLHVCSSCGRYIGKPYLPLDYPPPEYRVTIGPKNTTRGIVRNLSHKGHFFR